MKYPSIKFVFDRKKVATKAKTGLVQIEVSSERKRKWISTGVKIYAGQWNVKHLVISRLDADLLNNNLITQMEAIQNWVNDLRRRKDVFDFNKLEAFLQSRTMPASFLEYMESSIENRSDIRYNTRKGHRSVLHAVKKYGKIVSFYDLTRQNIDDFDKWLHLQDLSQSSVHLHHKVLKVYINNAIRHGLITNTPYTSIKIDRGKSTARKYLTQRDVTKLKEVELPTEAIIRTRDIFIFQCYTGLAYVDMARFDFSKVIEKNGKLILHDIRQKSSEDYYLVLLSPAIEILKKYDFKLPLSTNQKYNVMLKKLAKATGIDINLTSHVARHTFAVYCLNNGVPIETLAKMMGHTDIKTTQLYAKIANTTVEAAFDRLESAIVSGNTENKSKGQ